MNTKLSIVNKTRGNNDKLLIFSSSAPFR